MAVDPEPHGDLLQVSREYRSSVELDRDSKGIYRWAIKLYFDRDDGDEMPLLVQLSRIDDSLRRLFIPKEGQE
jgi:hypothetical protein